MSAPRPVRLWPLVVIAVLAVAAWIALWANEAPDRQKSVMASIAVGILALVLALLWLLFLSRLPWRVRHRGLAVAVALAILAGVLVEIRGVTGDLVPILAWRFAAEGDPTARDADGARPVVAGPHDWPGLYGPGRRAMVEGPALADWSEAPPTELWRRPVGPAWSSVAIVGDSLFTLEQHGPQEVLLRYLLADGSPVWSVAWDARYASTIAGLGPRTTPTVDRGVVFAHGATGVLVAVDAASGELRWRRDVVTDTGGVLPEWGAASSPLAVDDLVVVAGGIAAADDGPSPDGPSALVAYDRTTGDPVWRAGEDVPSFSSPQLAELAGRRQILAFNRGSASAHDPADGTLLWSVDWPAPQPNVAQPLVLPGDRLLLSTGYGIGSRLLQIEAAGNGTLSARELWSGPRLKSKFANVLFDGEALYGLDDGRFVALDPATGERRWKKGRYGHGQPVLVGDRIIVQAEDGSVVLLAADPGEHRELGTLAALSSKTWNPPVISGRTLVVRNDREMAAFELAVR